MLASENTRGLGSYLYMHHHSPNLSCYVAHRRANHNLLSTARGPLRQAVPLVQLRAGTSPFSRGSFSACCFRERARWTLSQLAVSSRTLLPKGWFTPLWPGNNLHQSLRRASRHVDGLSSVSGPSPACSACLFGTPRPLFPALHCPWSRWMRGPQVRYALPFLYFTISTKLSKDM